MAWIKIQVFRRNFLCLLAWGILAPNKTLALVGVCWGSPFYVKRETRDFFKKIQNKLNFISLSLTLRDVKLNEKIFQQNLLEFFKENFSKEKFTCEIINNSSQSLINAESLPEILFLSSKKISLYSHFGVVFYKQTLFNSFKC